MKKRILMLDNLNESADFEALREYLTESAGQIEFVETVVVDPRNSEVLFADEYDAEESAGDSAVLADEMGKDCAKPGKGGAIKMRLSKKQREIMAKNNDKYTEDALPPNVLARIYYNNAQESDTKNRNNRIYTDADMPKAVEHANNTATAGALFSLGGHPSQGINPKPSHIAGIIRRVAYENQTGKVGIVLDLLKGKQGEACVNVLRAGGALPISSRGRGKGEIVQHYKGRFGEYGSPVSVDGQPTAPMLKLSEYKFDGWDCIPGRQSVRGALFAPLAPVRGDARTEQVHESTTITSEEEHDMKIETVDQLKAHFPDIVKKLLEGASTSTTPAVDAEKAELTSQLLTQQKAEIARLTTELAAAKKAPVVTTEVAAAPASTDSPEVAALKRELAELKQGQHKAQMEAEVDNAIAQHKYSKILNRLRPMIINEHNIPDSKEVVLKRISVVEQIAVNVLTAYQENSSAYVAPPVIRPLANAHLRVVPDTHRDLLPDNGRTPEEQAVYEQSLAIAMGDTEEEDVG